MLTRTLQSSDAGSSLNAALAKRFAWLLRKDLREAFQDFDNPAFNEWWLIKGRIEYPAWTHAVPAEELQELFSPAGDGTVGGVPVDVPRVVQILARLRPDAVKQLSSEGKLDNEKFFAWAMVRGLAEHHLAVYAPRDVLAMLDQPVPNAKGEEGEDTPPVTLLMYLLWRLMDKPTQQAHDIRTAAGRAAFLPWFFGVVVALNITPLVAGRWKAWVKGHADYKGVQLDWANPPAIPKAPQPTSKETKPFGVNLYGFAYGELGIGEDLRMAVACCEAANIPCYVVNVDAGDIRQADTLLKGRAHELHSQQQPPYRTNIFCLPAFDTASRIFMQKGVEAFKGYHNIGWWPWELNVFPKAWRPYAFELVDEVWASSRFLYDMYKEATHKPVRLVPLAVSVDRLRKFARRHYGLPSKPFLFLYIFDFNSSVARKNPMAAVEAFKQAFPESDPNVGLVLKTMNADERNPDWKVFLAKCRQDKRIHVITETLARPEVLGLIDACDAYLSLHRAEGFGRTIAEAMLLAKPVVATLHSGCTDFLDPELTLGVNPEIVSVSCSEYPWISAEDGATWANANAVHASQQMRKALHVVDPAAAKKLQHFAKSLFDPSAVAERVQQCLSFEPHLIDRVA